MKLHLVLVKDGRPYDTLNNFANILKNEIILNNSKHLLTKNFTYKKQTTDTIIEINSKNMFYIDAVWEYDPDGNQVRWIHVIVIQFLQNNEFFILKDVYRRNCLICKINEASCFDANNISMIFCKDCRQNAKVEKIRQLETPRRILKKYLEEVEHPSSFSPAKSIEAYLKKSLGLSSLKIDNLPESIPSTIAKPIEYEIFKENFVENYIQNYQNDMTKKSVNFTYNPSMPFNK